MTIQLTPSWCLALDPSDTLVLLNLRTSEEFDPTDMVQPYPSWPLWPAWKQVARMASTNLALTPEDQAVILAWTKQPEGSDQ